MLFGAIGPRITTLLVDVNETAGFSMSLVCTDTGLLVASAGDDADEEHLAGLTSLFDDIVVRARRDLAMDLIDEVSMLDPSWGRCVIRPLPDTGMGRLFLVVRLDARGSWRRYSNKLRREIVGVLEAKA